VGLFCLMRESFLLSVRFIAANFFVRFTRPMVRVCEGVRRAGRVCGVDGNALELDALCSNTFATPAKKSL
jgi:hypothetical protein